MIKYKYWLLIFIFSLVTQLHADDDMQVEKKHVRFANGDSYYGDYEGRKRNGYGIYIWANGDRYKGEFFEGKRDGSGTYIWSNNEYYKGEYVDNKRDGEGSYFWTNGKRFKGSFADGRRDEGKLTTLSYTIKIPKIEININTRGKPAPDRPTSKDNAEKYELKIVANDAENNFTEEQYDNSNEEEIQEDKLQANYESVDDSEEITDNVEGDTSASVATNHEDDILSDKERININEELTDDNLDDIKESYSILAEVDDKIVPEIKKNIQVESDNNSTDIQSEAMLASVITSAKFKQPSVPTQIDTPDIDPEITIANNESTTGLVGKVEVTWPNGDSYDGEYINGERTGKGIYTWANGDYYFGDFVKGKRHGVGIYKWKNGDKYIGEYLNDKRTGEGLYIWTSGDRYQGDFDSGFRHGKGTLKWVDGELYGGDFLYGKRTGRGIYISSGGDRYEGQFKDGKRTGKGFLISANGSLKKLEFEENPYLLQELHFDEGKLVSATAEEVELEE
ncbi:MAG TPA: hypothetical protein ENK59_09790 [Thioploca sp.]|nr:hypothetical protein [Thioploca sp.]